MPKEVNEERKKQNLINFIHATQQLMETEDIDNVSIRKIASKTNFHNSTIYLYFEDLDQLIMLASVKYFTEYSHALMLHGQKYTPPNENFIDIWSLFIDATLKKPKIFYNFFFGSKSGHLQDFLIQYYELFPEEQHLLPEMLKTMYYGENITYRCLELLRTLTSAENLVQEANLSIVNEIIVSFFKYKLEQKCHNPALDCAQIKQEILGAICHVTGITPAS